MLPWLFCALLWLFCTSRRSFLMSRWLFCAFAGSFGVLPTGLIRLNVSRRAGLSGRGNLDVRRSLSSIFDLCPAHLRDPYWPAAIRLNLLLLLNEWSGRGGGVVLATTGRSWNRAGGLAQREHRHRLTLLVAEQPLAVVGLTCADSISGDQFSSCRARQDAREVNVSRDVAVTALARSGSRI